jgi:hypothetical protein
MGDGFSYNYGGYPARRSCGQTLPPAPLQHHGRFTPQAPARERHPAAGLPGRQGNDRTGSQDFFAYAIETAHATIIDGRARTRSTTRARLRLRPDGVALRTPLSRQPGAQTRPAWRAALADGFALETAGMPPDPAAASWPPAPTAR